MSAVRPSSQRRPTPSVALCAGIASLSAYVLACGGSQRPAADPDFRTLQVHEARVSELGARAQDAALECSARLGAAERCLAEVSQARTDAEGVRDADLDARIERLAQLCEAATGTAQAQCGSVD